MTSLQTLGGGGIHPSIFMEMYVSIFPAPLSKVLLVFTTQHHLQRLRVARETGMKLRASIDTAMAEEEALGDRERVGFVH